MLRYIPKACQCTQQALIIAKLDTYDVEKSSLDFIYSFLKVKEQRTKVVFPYSHWEAIISGAPQGSSISHFQM